MSWCFHEWNFSAYPRYLGTSIHKTNLTTRDLKFKTVELLKTKGHFQDFLPVQQSRYTFLHDI